MIKKLRFVFLVLVVWGSVSCVGFAEELEWFEEVGVGVDGGEEFGDGFGETVVEGPLVFLDGEFLNHDIFKVSVRVERALVPLLGAAFHLKYDPDELAFLRYDPGEFFEMGGDPFYLVMDSGKGRIVFGETLRRGDSFPVGEGVFVSIYFQEFGDGVYDFEFEKGVLSTLDEIRQDLDSVAFVGGSFDRNAVVNDKLGENGEEYLDGRDEGESSRGNPFSASVMGNFGGNNVFLIVIGAGVAAGFSVYYFVKYFWKRRQY